MTKRWYQGGLSLDRGGSYIYMLQNGTELQ